MSSKGKKTSRKPSRTLINDDNDIDNGAFLRNIEAASKTFPSLIGKTAFIGRIACIDNQNEYRANTIWLSESSMLCSSFTHDTLVSVSSPTSSINFHSFPLISLSDEFAKHTGTRFCDQDSNEAGNYFSLAKIRCSTKVSKNEVRLSSNLANTMGAPTLGRTVFVYPVLTQIAPNLLTKDENLLVSKAIPLPIFDCSELYLELVHSMESTLTSTSSKTSSEISYGSVNGAVGSTSPRTPMNKKKSSSSIKSQLTSSTDGDFVNWLASSNGLSIDSLDITKLLGDESSARRLLDRCATPWLYNRCLLLGNLVTIPFFSEKCTFRVVGAKKLFAEDSCYDMSPKVSEPPEHSVDAFMVQRVTKVRLRSPSKPLPESAYFGDEDLKIDGLSEEYRMLMEIICSATENILSGVVRPTKGVLLHGPIGTGKTSLALLCARNSGVNTFIVNLTELVSATPGESERTLYEVFESAQQAAPAVVLIDELDTIAPARRDGGDVRLLKALLSLMDGTVGTEGVFIIATTSRPDSVNPALRRSGRFDREIVIDVPSPDQRLNILRCILGDMEHFLSDDQVQKLANSTHGYVGADLASLCSEAADISLRKYIDTISVQDSGCCEDSGDSLQNSESMLKLDFECFEEAKMKVKPSAMREVTLEVPKVRWEDVGGQRDVKRKLIEAVIWPQKHPESFRRIGTCPPTAVLMYGPPGCSKTLLARAVASEAGLNFLAVKGPELFSKWVGESEKAVKSLFARARANAPSIIFFDEIDGLASIRGKEGEGVTVSDRVISQLLIEMDGLPQRVDVTVIAATNRLDKIDSALLRPGRFGQHLHVKPPDENDRREIFNIHLRGKPCSSDVSINELASLTEGFTGADISSIYREAALNALEDNFEASEVTVTMQHLRKAIENAQPSIQDPTYQELPEKFQKLHVSQKQICLTNAQI